MCDNERRLLAYLTLVAGFSRRNAEIAIEMFRAGELTNAEWTVINRISLEPDPEKEHPVVFQGSSPVMWVADHLNYRITLNGGNSVTKSNSLNRAYCNRPSYYLSARAMDVRRISKSATKRYR